MTDYDYSQTETPYVVRTTDQLTLRVLKHDRNVSHCLIECGPTTEMGRIFFDEMLTDFEATPEGITCTVPAPYVHECEHGETTTVNEMVESFRSFAVEVMDDLVAALKEVQGDE